VAVKTSLQTNGKSHSERASRWKTRLVLLLLLSLVVMFIALNMGFSQIPIQDVAQIVAKNVPGVGSFIQLTPFQMDKEPIIMLVRMPRVLCGALVGAALAGAGAIFQGMFRNPMADPFVIGASQGAALGAALAIVLGLGAAFLGNNAIPIFAFVGCVSSVLVVYAISRIGSRVPLTTLLLSGIAVGLFELAIITYLQTIAGDKLGPLTFWIIGSLSSSRVTWDGLLSILPFIAVGFIIAFLYSRDLNLLSLGEDQAQHLGVNTERVKFILLITGAFMTAAAVSISGLIGFIGLMIPHLTRLLVGPDHRVMIPASVLMGASFLVLSDGITRMLTSPSSPGEIPVGVITVMSGVVFFLFLLRKKKRVDAF